jgi:hypothetical protein
MHKKSPTNERGAGRKPLDYKPVAITIKAHPEIKAKLKRIVKAKGTDQKAEISELIKNAPEPDQ